MTYLWYNHTATLIKREPSRTFDVMVAPVDALIEIQTGKLKVEDWARACINRINIRDLDVGAWVYFDQGSVIEQAKALDKVPLHKRQGLHGLPMGVKDIIHVAGMPTRFNSEIYKHIGHCSEADSDFVKCLREAGALIIGKTTTTEFGASPIGPSTRNPHDLRRTPGGSSTGSGAAVGDLQVPVAIGTQTGGSTIRPASFNGIWGVVFTMHDISTRGQKAFAPTFDRPSVLACDVDILKLIAKVLKIKDDKKKHLKTIRGTRFAFCKTPLWNHAGQGTKAAMEQAAELLRAHGVKVEELQLHPQFNQVADWYDTVLYKEGHKSFLPYYDDCKEKLDPTIVNLVEKGTRISNREYQEALQGLAALRLQMDEIASRYAAIIAPSVPDEAPIGLKDTGSYVFAKFWTALHGPCLNVPGFRGENGMPIGLTLYAARGRDEHLLDVGEKVGKIFENSGGWRKPPMRSKL